MEHGGGHMKASLRCYGRLTLSRKELHRPAIRLICARLKVSTQPKAQALTPWMLRWATPKCLHPAKHIWKVALWSLYACFKIPNLNSAGCIEKSRRVSCQKCQIIKRNSEHEQCLPLKQTHRTACFFGVFSSVLPVVNSWNNQTKSTDLWWFLVGTNRDTLTQGADANTHSGSLTPRVCK